jgi:hypothetical protein
MFRMPHGELLLIVTLCLASVMLVGAGLGLLMLN